MTSNVKTTVPGMSEKARLAGYRRNHHTTTKNQKTRMRKTMYHNQRHPWRSAILLMRRNVPARMPDVSENASFCPTKHAKKEYKFVSQPRV